MTTNIQSVHFDADKKLIDFANEKMNKLIHASDEMHKSGMDEIPE